MALITTGEKPWQGRMPSAGTLVTLLMLPNLHTLLAKPETCPPGQTKGLAMRSLEMAEYTFQL